VAQSAATDGCGLVERLADRSRWIAGLDMLVAYGDELPHAPPHAGLPPVRASSASYKKAEIFIK